MDQRILGMLRLLWQLPFVGLLLAIVVYLYLHRH